MEPSSPEQSPQNPLEQRTRHYQNRAEKLLNRYGRDFARFVQGYEQLVTEGDERLKSIETTGYNILHRAGDMPLASKRPLIFYGNYIERTRHFGLLLAKMEQEKVITQDQARLGVRGTKVLWDTDWGKIPEFTQSSTIQRTDKNGATSDHQVVRSVETVITFLPGSDDQAVKIASFLNEKANAREPGAIADSNLDPDIRATAALRDVLPKSEFSSAIANILKIGQAQVIALRQTTGFSPTWRAVKIGANEELVGYIAGEGVLP